MKIYSIKLLSLSVISLVLVMIGNAVADDTTPLHEEFLRAKLCIDSYSTRVFLDGANPADAVSVALVQCSESIGSYVDIAVQEVEKETGKELSDRTTSKLVSDLISELRDFQIYGLSGYQWTN